MYKDKSFEEKFTAFGICCESISIYSVYAGSGEDKDYYRKEYKAQLDRVNWLYNELVNDYNNKSIGCLEKFMNYN
jgi:hypothetical protein